jgi:hypothetical protein
MAGIQYDSASIRSAAFGMMMLFLVITLIRDWRTDRRLNRAIDEIITEHDIPTPPSAPEGGR